MSPERRQCTAIAKATGQRCRKAPILGGSVCAKHGGSAGQVRRAAARRLETAAVEAEVANLVAFDALEGVSDPLGVLAELAARALATERALSARVNELAQDDRLRYQASGSGAEMLRAEVGLWERWHKQAAHLADALAKHNWEARRVALNARQGRLAAEIVKAIFARLDLSPAQAAMAPVVAAEEFRRAAAIERATVEGQVVP
jgi:hypothetical protein